MNTPLQKPYVLVFGVALLAAGLITLFSSLFIVDQAEQAIIVELGEPKGELIARPGLYWKKPFIQVVRRFDKRLLVWDGDPNQIPTLGREFISVDTTARWRIVDPLRFLKSVRDEAGARSRLDDIIDSVVRDKVSNTELEEIVRSKDWNPRPAGAVEEVEVLGKDAQLAVAPKKGREQLTREITLDAQKVIAPLGIELVDVRIRRLNYIDEVRSKVEDRMISERERVAEHFRSEGAGRSAEIDGETEREQQRIASEGGRRAEEIRGRADAEVTSIYGGAYGRDAEFYAFFRTLESYSKSIGANTTLMVRANSELYKYLQDISVRRQ
ncbi:MAG TPA: protease modulator HflC [Polyangiales bacterium]|nr:protease modulator HflC [Polyangiales bacterium]